MLDYLFSILLLNGPTKCIYSGMMLISTVVTCRILFKNVFVSKKFVLRIGVNLSTPFDCDEAKIMVREHNKNA